MLRVLLARSRPLPRRTRPGVMSETVTQGAAIFGRRFGTVTFSGRFSLGGQAALVAGEAPTPRHSTTPWLSEAQDQTNPFHSNKPHVAQNNAYPCACKPICTPP